MVAAIAVEKTGNAKTGPVSVTMASQQSCPVTCSLRNNGCYAEAGPQGIHTHRLNRSETISPLAIAIDEANAIDKLSGTRPLRLHIVGDCTTEVAVSVLARAAARYPMNVWTYTHAWRTLLRRSWGKISAMASCESLAEVKQAMAAGYAAILITPKFQSDKAYKAEGLTIIPCPQQTGKTANCTTCRLCWDDKALAARQAVIAFEPHGTRSKTVLRVLTQ